MKYVPPFDATEENAPYVNGSPEHGIEGSVVPAECVEHPQLEIVEVIKRAGLAPSGEDTTQLWQALEAIFKVKVPLATLERPGLMYPDGSTCTVDNVGMLTQLPGGGWNAAITYKRACTVVHAGNLYIWLAPSGPSQVGVGAKEPGTAGSKIYWLDYADYLCQRVMDRRIGQYEWWEDDMPREGYFSCLGGTVQNFAAKYPKAAAYFETSYGQSRLVTQAEYDALHVYSWYTSSDGIKVGWNGIGGVAKFVWDKQADTLRLPDLAGMTPEQVGFSDSLGVGGVRPDQIRNITGFIMSMYSFSDSYPASYTGGAINGIKRYTTTSNTAIGSSGDSDVNITLDANRIVSTGPRNHGPRYISDARVYLGRPSL